MTSRAVVSRPGSWPVRCARTAQGMLDRIPLSLIQLLMRISVGAVFFTAGWLKYRSWEITLLLFRDEYRMPLLDPSWRPEGRPSTSSRSRPCYSLGWAHVWLRYPFWG